jgi:hypothetical protein
MAESHSTREEKKSSRAQTAQRRGHTRTLPRKASAPRASRRQSKRRQVTGSRHQLTSELRDISRLLGIVYSSCVTAELALQRQNADLDQDIVAALRAHVSDPVSRQIEKIDLLAAELA